MAAISLCSFSRDAVTSLHNLLPRPGTARGRLAWMSHGLLPRCSSHSWLPVVRFTSLDGRAKNIAAMGRSYKSDR